VFQPIRAALSPQDVQDEDGKPDRDNPAHHRECAQADDEVRARGVIPQMDKPVILKKNSSGIHHSLMFNR
jgi:hypothetical protein